MYYVAIVASPGCPLQNIRNKRAVESAWKCRWCFWQPFPGTHSYDETPLIVIFWCAPASRTHLNTKSFFFALGVRLEAQSCVIVLSMTGPSCEKRDTNKIYICTLRTCSLHDARAYIYLTSFPSVGSCFLFFNAWYDILERRFGICILLDCFLVYT